MVSLAGIITVTMFMFMIMLVLPTVFGRMVLVTGTALLAVFATLFTAYDCSSYCASYYSCDCEEEKHDDAHDHDHDHDHEHDNVLPSHYQKVPVVQSAPQYMNDIVTRYPSPISLRDEKHHTPHHVALSSGTSNNVG